MLTVEAQNLPLVSSERRSHICKEKTVETLCFNGLAEKERFELSLGFTPTTPLAGEPLRPLGYFSIQPASASNIKGNGGERGIRTPGAFRHHWFSRPAPSTARPSLRILSKTDFRKHTATIPLKMIIVNPSRASFFIF